MNRKQKLVFASGLIGVIAYVTRRQWIARWLHLTSPKNAVAVERATPMEMPDGVRLIADHYFPKARGTFPTILMRTPYGRNTQGGLLGVLQVFLAQRFAERGYHVIVQDTRGRFDSEGVFEPFVDEARDGRATLEWIARQPWFDGNLGMWGQSYGGYVQWAAAVDAPTFLKAIVPSITGSRINPYTGSAFGLDGMIRWVFNLTRTGNPLQRLLTELPYYLDPEIRERTLRRAFEHLPIAEAEARVIGEPVWYYRKWLAPENARTDAPFWQSAHHGSRMERVHAATHLISGWYDILLHQLLEDYAALRAAGDSPYLTIGPWRHLDLEGVAETLCSGLTWFDTHLKGKQRLRAKPVRVYVMGTQAWREFDAFPPPAQTTHFFLRALGQLATDQPDPSSSPDRYRYDPAHPTPSLGGPVYSLLAGSFDNRAIEARDDVLTYTTLPLPQALDVIGPVRAELFVRSSLPHTDFFARLCDAHPDGRSMNVCDGLLRVEPDIGELQPDGSLKIVIDLWSTAQRFARGHRIRLQVSSGAHPRWARNLGTGEPLATATRMQVAEQTIYHDAAHPSALILPVIEM